MSAPLVDFKKLHEFKTWPWLRQGHGQTLAGHFWPSIQLPKNSIQINLPIDETDSLSIRYYERSTKTVVILFHGLGSDIQADYMRRNAFWCLQKNYSCVLVNHRGHGEGYGLAQEITHAGRWQDAEFMIQWARLKWPEAKIITVGFSLSGCLLLNLLAQPAASQPDFALVVNAPLNLKKAALKLRHGFSRIYDFRFQQRLRKKIDPQLKIPRWATVYDFDELYTAPRSGFLDREDYYSKASSISKIENIRTPTVMLMAQDDPIVDFQDYLEVKENAFVQSYVTKSGGHMGYLARSKSPLGSRHWLDYFIDYVIQDVHSRYFKP